MIVYVSHELYHIYIYDVFMPVLSVMSTDQIISEFLPLARYFEFYRQSSKHV